MSVAVPQRRATWHEAYEQAELTALYTKFFETAHRAGDSA